MNKKTKLILMLFLAMLIALNFLGTVNAHSIELDPESYITMPYALINGSGTISIRSSVTDYTLYYQAIQISSTVYSEMEKIYEDGQAKLDDIDVELTALDADVDNLKEIYDSAYDAYEAGLTNNGLTADELEALKTAYETARTNYQNKVSEYNDKVDEYNAKVSEINSKIKELTPTYIEDNWTQTTDNKVSIDITQFSGEQAYVVWAKLVTSDGTYYDELIYATTGTKEEEVDVTGVSLSVSSLSIENGSSYTLVATITPSDATDKTLKWSSSNENVATVSDGKITAKSAGTTTITVTTNDGGYTATCKVTVTEKSSAAGGTNNVDNTTSGGTNSVDNTTSGGTNSVDNTTASGTLPQTGISSIPIILVAVISILGIIFYKKYKYYNV